MGIQRNGQQYQAFGPQPDPYLTIRQIETMGYNVLWRRSLVCPNRIGGVDNHNLNCTICDRTGFVYETGTPQKMLIMGVSLRQMYQSFGRIDAGTCYVTAMPEVQLSWWDKIELTESIINFQQAVQRNTAATSDKLRYAIVDTADVPGVLIVRGGDGTTYQRGTHFTVTDGKLVWLSGGPANGSFYSVRYLVRPVYRILDVNHHVRDLPSFGPNGIAPKGNGNERSIRFPIQAIGRLEYLPEGASE